jgi:broad specificity phosphatase PhoE
MNSRKPTPAHNLLFIRHSLPDFDPALPANQWHLSEQGRQRAGLLAERLAGFHLQVIVASQEPKAGETAQILAEALRIPCRTAPGLHEHQRSRAAYTSQEDFGASIQALFDQPDFLVFGDETAGQAYTRFAQAVQAVQAVQENYLGQSPLAIVSHGTVISLYVARLYGLDPYPFWKSLTLPCMVILSTPHPEIVSLEAGYTP